MNDTAGPHRAPARSSDRAAPPPVHEYRAGVRWSGSTGAGYEHYDRTHVGTTDPPTTELALASAPAFRGDPALLDPEQLLVLAAASCQLLSFLAVAARARLDVVRYDDHARGEMSAGRRPECVERIALRPHIVLAVDGAVAADPPETLLAKLNRLVEVAHRECYIANSVRSEITVVPAFEFVDSAR